MNPNPSALLVVIASVILMVSNSCDNTNSINNTSQKTAYNVQIPKDNLVNGIYLIKNEFMDSSETESYEDMIVFNHDFLEGNKEGQPVLLEIDPNEYVELELSEKPIGVVQPDDRLNLVISLTEDAKVKLAKFTEKHLNEKVAIVIGNRAVTKHKVRSKIDGGRLQIYRCTDNACEHLIVELEKSIK